MIDSLTLNMFETASEESKALQGFAQEIRLVIERMITKFDDVSWYDGRPGFTNIT